MPMGAERIDALKRAGKIRFEADKLRQNKEARIRTHSEQVKEDLKAKIRTAQAGGFAGGDGHGYRIVRAYAALN